MAEERCRPRPPVQENRDILRTITRVPETLVPGRSIRIRGFVPPNATRFSINLQRGDRPYSDNIVLHFDVRFDQNIVIRNHFVQGSGWGGPEEREGIMPFRRDSRFEIIFTIEQNFIRVTVNGAHFTNFNHRLPFVDINHVHAHLDVDIRLVSFEEPF